MAETREIAITKERTIGSFLTLVKFRLTMTVVLTSLLGMLIASGGDLTVQDLLVLAIGGFLVTGASNAFNQALEKDYDRLMSRTQNRPVASGRMSLSTAVMIAGLMAVSGLIVLSYFNLITAFLGALALVTYSFVYTPLKRVTSWSVAIGAIPGALPVMIGCVALQGDISKLAWLLFGIQFLWQFPHFWSIGFLAFDDYNKASFKVVPSTGNDPDRQLGWYAFCYAIAILPLILFMGYLDQISLVAVILVSLITCFFSGIAFRFHRKFDRDSARTLMFSSLIYMPLLLMILLIDIL